MDTVEYEDGKAFVVSSFVSEDAAEAGGSASLILKKMAVLIRTASPKRALAVKRRRHGVCRRSS